MPKHHSPTILKAANIANRTLTKKQLFFVILAALFGILVYNLWLEYHPRPLADGFTYVGRDYNSGCAVFKLDCWSPETETLYYATDVEPTDAMKKFVGWEMKGTQMGASSSSTVYTFSNQRSNDQSFGIEYMTDQQSAPKSPFFLPFGGKYLVSISKEGYETYK